MGISNQDGEFERAIMKVMIKIFSAKVVLKRLPDTLEHKNAIVQNENFELIPEQKGKRKMSNKHLDGRSYEEKSNKEILQPAEQNCDPNPEPKARNPKGGSSPTKIPDKLLVNKMYVYYCSTCNKEKDSINTTKKCSNCKERLLIKCSKCNRTYKRMTNMVRHLMTKCTTQKNNKHFECEYKNSIQISELDHYMNVHEPTSVECSECGITLKNERTLRVHQTYCNKNAPLFWNDENGSLKTGIPVSSRTYRNRHLQKTNNDCSKCGKVFLNRMRMKRHLFNCRRPENFSSKNGFYDLRRKGKLENHMLRIHLRNSNSDRDFCPKCGVAFKSKKFSKGHLRFCGTSKLHLKCNYCYYMTHNKYSLRIHLRNIHSQEINNIQTQEETKDIQIED
ncbi:zinc finger protein 510-like [Phymastichus coffea]|uniref:zinc finger protein 510-like n=1 Tax=Phymastichus coffea TaxID=108790 RepID=UPI00273AAA7F|nr:zinc finger protein 510-like [Phymastichus coffea]XP_058793607.1 zinc finger protein 510-like [Phymastichus coffea]XP_058793608.1 zinc finger protein 510-like [Phymastichus coffea]XP_058793609.1 zinc finger protein 510-like [Phymastichus coffea]XP_058793610.1 zinc finger protein 510-like [Phymastichus coffea]XP_058793611.1 zinc finger protein 510-like [Phymastichus coffea]XP_058793612.1 zinc finger protein 510-like [Phymastichus coffea]